MEREQRKALFLYIFSMVIFGSNGVVASFIGIDSYEIVFTRTVLGGLVLGSLFFLGKNRMQVFSHKKQMGYLLISGTAMVTSWMFQFESYEYVGVSVATMLYYSGPIIVMVCSPMLFKEKLTASKIIGLVFVTVGVLLINGKLEGADNAYGVFCGLMSAVLYAVMVMSNKKAVDIDGLEIAFIQLVVAFFVSGGFIVLRQGFTIDFAKSDILPVLILGVINTGYTCYLYFTTLKSLPVQSVALWGYIDLLASVVFAYMFLNEKLNFFQMIGGVLIIGGAVVGEFVVLRKVKGKN